MFTFYTQDLPNESWSAVYVGQRKTLEHIIPNSLLAEFGIKEEITTSRKALYP